MIPTGFAQNFECAGDSAADQATGHINRGQRRLAKLVSVNRTSRERSRAKAPSNDAWLFAVLIAIVACVPLPLGSNRPLPAAIFASAIAMLLVAWSALILLKRINTRTELRHLSVPGLFYGIVCLWIFFQWLPWMPSQVADPIWESSATTLGLSLRDRISVNPEATLSGLMNLLSYASVFWLTLQLTRNSQRAWSCVRALTLIGATYSLYGIIVFISGNNWILIFPKWAYLDSLTSTFVNRNSFATFAGLALLCAGALLLERLTPYFGINQSLHAKLLLILEELVGKLAWVTGAAVVISVALLMSGSRAGIASTLIGATVLLVIYAAHRRLKFRQAFVILPAIAVIGIIIFSASGNVLTKRLGVDYLGSSFDVRFNVYEETWKAIQTTPWTGTGFGTFADVFPAYRTPEFITPVLWDKAHNTYLENALELGLPASILLNLALSSLALQALRGALMRKRDALVPALGISASMLVGIHSLVDFSLQIPAVTILYACIMGVAIGQSTSQRQKSSTLAV